MDMQMMDRVTAVCIDKCLQQQQQQQQLSSLGLGHFEQIFIAIRKKWANKMSNYKKMKNKYI